MFGLKKRVEQLEEKVDAIAKAENITFEKQPRYKANKKGAKDEPFGFAVRRKNNGCVCVGYVIVGSDSILGDDLGLHGFSHFCLVDLSGLLCDGGWRV